MVDSAKLTLKTISFAAIEQWDIKRFMSTSISSKYKLQKLGKFLNNEAKKTKLFNYPAETFKILGISNDIGMFDAYEELGANINQPYIEVKDNFLAYNPYRVNVGSIGIKSEVLNHNFISPAYVVFSCKNSLSPKFLFLIMKSDKFNLIIRDNTTGSVRQTLSFSNLERIKIPVPETIEEQNCLVEKYENTLEEAERCEKEAERLDASIEEYLFDILGIETTPKIRNTHKLLKNYYLSQISRWDVWTQNNEFYSNKYKYTSLGNFVLGSPLYGANEKAKKEISDTRYIRITDINEDGSLNGEFVSAVKVENKYLLEENDFLIARSGNTVGKTFLYNSKYGRCIFAGYLIKYVLKTDKIIPEYLLYYTKSFLFKSWIKSNQRIFGQPNINGQEYLKAQIIVPEIREQEQIVLHITEIKEQVKALRQKAESLRSLAKKDFEEAVFSEA